MLSQLTKEQQKNAVCFFRETEIHYGIFSNWAYTPFVYNDLLLPTAEHGMMIAKFDLFNKTDTEDRLRLQMLRTNSPMMVKKLGRLVPNFDQAIWDSKNIEIMVDVLFVKFSQNDDAKEILLSTDDRFIVEASPYDRIWGIGITADEFRSGKKARGENRLGSVLMMVRDRLREQERNAQNIIQI